MKDKRNWIVAWACGLMLVCVALSLAMGAVGRPGRQEPPGMRRLREAKPEERMSVMESFSVEYLMADISLEVREQDDFLLTPALLVQEAVSDGIVLTYPEE